jgi:hypothetical protein
MVILALEIWMKKAVLKYAAGVLDKLAVGSMLVGLYQGKSVGVYIGVACFTAGAVFSAWEAKK